MSRRLRGCVREPSPELYQNGVGLARLPDRPGGAAIVCYTDPHFLQRATDVNWQQQLRIRTHDPRFLWRIVIVVMVCGGLAGILVRGLTSSPRQPAVPETAIEAPGDEGEVTVGTDTRHYLFVNDG